MQVANHTTEVQVLPQSVRLRYEVLIPVHDAEQEALLQDVDQLVAGLVVMADGASLPLELLEEQRVTDGHEHRAVLLLSAPLPPDAHDLEVGTGNYPFSPGVFTWNVALHRSFSVGSTNLRNAETTPATWLDGTEMPGESARSLELELSPRFGMATPLWLRLTPRQPWQQTLQESARTAPLSRLRHHEPTPVGTLLALLVGAAAGALSPPRPAERDPATALCFLSWLVVAGTCHPQLNASLDLLALPMVAVVLWGTRAGAPEWAPRLSSAALVAATALATGSGVLGGFVWVAWAAVRGTLSERLPTWSLRALALGVSAPLLLRAFYA